MRQFLEVLTSGDLDLLPVTSATTACQINVIRCREDAGPAFDSMITSPGGIPVALASGSEAGGLQDGHLNAPVAVRRGSGRLTSPLTVS